MKDFQRYIDELEVGQTSELMAACMDNMTHEEIVNAIMKKVNLEDMFADEMESAIQNYAAGLEDDAE